MAPDEHGAGRAPAGCEIPEERAPSVWRDLLRHAAELADFGRLYAEARRDQIMARVRSALLWAAVGLGAALIAAVMSVAAAVYLVAGLARGLAVLFGDRIWLGYLVAGLVILAGFGAAAAIILARLRASFRRKKVQYYEQRKASQREQFGRDISQLASGTDGGRVPRSADS